MGVLKFTQYQLVVHEMGMIDLKGGGRGKKAVGRMPGRGVPETVGSPGGAQGGQAPEEKGAGWVQEGLSPCLHVGGVGSVLREGVSPRPGNQLRSCRLQPPLTSQVK